MKRTIIAFSVTLMLAIALFLGIGLTGCEWFETSVLGKQSKAEIEAMKKKEQEDTEALEKMKKDEAERLIALQEREKEQSQINNNKKYHIIVGSYEDSRNVENMMSLLKNKGFEPQTFTVYGLTCVSMNSFTTLLEAENYIDEVYDLGIYEEDDEDDPWVYTMPS